MCSSAADNRETMWSNFRLFPSRAVGVETGRTGMDSPPAVCSFFYGSKPSESSAATRRFELDIRELQIELDNSYAAAASASRDSEDRVSHLYSEFEAKTKAAEHEVDLRMRLERTNSKIATKLATDASDLLLANQRREFESAVIVATRTTNATIATLTLESQLASKLMNDDVESRFALQRFTSDANTKIALELSEGVLDDQQKKHEVALSVANAAVMLSDAILKLETIARNTERVGYAKVAADQLKVSIAAESAKEDQEMNIECLKQEQILLLKSMERKYKKAAIAASDASELSMEALRVDSELASQSAQKVFTSQILSERAESEVAAKVLERVHADNLADQQHFYETAATAATEAHKSSIEILQEDSKTIIEAFNLEIIAKDFQYVVAKLSAERLEQQILTDRLAQATASAQKESELLLSVCGNVVHDLNSPLQTLIHGIESLRTEHSKSLGPSGPSDDLLDTLESACAFMRSAISRTIDFTEANNGIGLTPLMTTISLQNSLNVPLKWIRSMLPPDGRVTVALEPLPEGVNIISTDQRWLEENLLCLLSNGVKFSSEGTVRIVPTLRKGMLRITVEDNGIGIDVDVRLKLFQQISQVQRLSVGGAGLGLYSLSKRSQAIGGSCGEDGRVNGQPGSSFWFEFPFLPIQEPTLFLRGMSRSISSTAKGEPSFTLLVDDDDDGIVPLHVLIVDDSIAVVKMLSNKLMSFGYLVTTAKNGAEGLEKMISSHSKLDLVIMDLQMPVMDGIEATRKYRENERERDRMLQKSDSFRKFDSMSPIMSKQRRRLPIICSSANCSGEAGLRAIEAGVDSFLPKPFNLLALTAALKEALGTSAI